MMAPTHFLFGVACQVACYPLPSDQFLTAGVAACLADADLKGSWAGQCLGKWGYPFRKFVGGHRSKKFFGTHRIWAPLWLAVPSWFLSEGFAYSLVMGYYSHLLADKIYDTDGWLEHFIRFALWPVIIAGVIYRIYRGG